VNAQWKGVLAIALALGLSGCGSSYVRQGHVGLLVNNLTGNIDQVLDPGYRLAAPVGQHIIEFPVIKQQYVMVRGSEGQHAEQDDSVQVNSVEGQAFNVDASVEYMVHDKQSVAGLYRRYGMDFDNIVERYYRSKFKSAIVDSFASMPLNEAITGDGRHKVEKMALTELRDALSQDHLDVDQVMIRAVYVPESISNSIAAKTQAENDLVKARTIAQKQVVEAEAEAKARLIRAKAEADANKMISASLTDQLIRKLYVEKLSDKVQLVLPSNGFYSLGGILPGADQAIAHAHHPGK